GGACAYRARGRELLARTGSLARVNPRVLRVLPKVRTPPTGRPAFSRYACVQGPGIEARWRKIPTRHAGTDVRSEYANLLLLPWPLDVHASDFRPLDDSVRRPTNEPYAFFEFAPPGVSTSIFSTGCSCPHAKRWAPSTSSSSPNVPLTRTKSTSWRRSSSGTGSSRWSQAFGVAQRNQVAPATGCT